MGSRSGWAAVLLLSLVLGVANAGGRTLAVTQVTVQVIGKGRVTSTPEGIRCGNGDRTCHIAFSGSGTPPIALEIDAADDWNFGNWLGCDTPESSPTCEIAHDGGEHDVTVRFSGPATTTSTLSAFYDNTYGDGNVAGGEIDCGSNPLKTDCTWLVPTGSTLTVLATPKAGDAFTGWSGACSGTDVACTVEMDGNRSVVAAWGGSTDTKLLTVSITGRGSVSGGGIDCPPTCSALEPTNSTVTLTANPNERDGYDFTSWSGGCAGSTPTCTVRMGAAETVTATFTAVLPRLSVAVTGSGNVTGGTGAINCGSGGNICSAGFTLNSTVTLTATPATGATFMGWTGACGGTATTCTVSMNASKSVTATFSAVSALTLTVSVTGAGTVTGGGINCGGGASTCTANQTLNAVVVLTATPAPGGTFNGWGGACSGITTTCSLTMTSARTVTATFSGGPSSTTFLLSVSVSGGGTVTGGGISCGNGATTCSADETANSTVRLTATPAAGARFTGWGGACSGSTTTCTVTMNADKSVSATFTGGGATMETLTIGVSGRGTVASSAGKCVGGGTTTKTCTQRFATGKSVVLTATPATGATFQGWSGACTGTKTTCTVKLDAAKSVTATFSSPRRIATSLTRLGPAVVKSSGDRFLVTLRFRTKRAGTARVVGLRAGRVVSTFSLRIGAGPATIGPFPVSLPGLYTFEVQLRGSSLRWRACLGRCGADAPGPDFVLTREPATARRTGDIWSVTLHLRANLISEARVRAYRGTKLLVDKHFLAHAGAISVGPFLLGPGSYTLRLTATDPYGRTRTLSWIVALAR